MFKMPKSGRKGGLLVEILMIVVGINVALWFEGWFEDLRDAETEAQYLLDLREDLRADIRSLDHLIEVNTEKLTRIGEIVGKLDQLAETSPEEQAGIMYAPSSYGFFQPSDFTYRSMQESGDFRLLASATIKKRILQLNRHHNNIAMLQDNFLQALDDGYIPLLMDSFDIADGNVADPSIFDNVTFRNFFPYTMQETRAMVSYYEVVRKRSIDLIAQNEAWQGKRGGLLRTVSLEDGKPLATCKIDGVPVFDGMSAAAGRLYLATQDGKIVCFGAAGE